MYLFSADETNSIAQVMYESVDSELRGWNQRKYYTKLCDLNISNIVNSYCLTNRKIYQLSRGVYYGQSEAMIVGSAIHSIVEKIYEKVLEGSDKSKELLQELADFKDDKFLMYLIRNGDKLQALRDLSASNSKYEEKLTEIKELLRNIVDFEIERLKNHDLISEVVILDLEKYVNGNSFSIGSGKIDVVFNYKNSIGIGDLKSGKPWKDNYDAKLQITIYAMLLETEIKKNVDWGVIIFPFEYDGEGRSLSVQPFKIIFPISSKLRKEALLRFDKIEKLLCEGKEPQICIKCRSQSLCLKEVNI